MKVNWREFKNEREIDTFIDNNYAMLVEKFWSEFKDPDAFDKKLYNGEYDEEIVEIMLDCYAYALDRNNWI